LARRGAENTGKCGMWCSLIPGHGLLKRDMRQMAQYWKTHPKAPTAPGAPPPATTAGASTLPGNVIAGSVQLKYDRHRDALMAQKDNSDNLDGGWQAELRRYLSDTTYGVTKETDIIEWWQVCILSFLSQQFAYPIVLIRTIANNIQPLHESLSTSFPCKRPPYLANACFRQVSKQLMIVVLVWVPKGLKSSKS
jgi:hypothetical protein